LRSWLLAVPSKADIAAYADAIDDLTAVAFGQLKALLLALDNPNPVAFRDSVSATYPLLLQPYLVAAAEVATIWYEELRVAAGVTTVYPSPPVVPLPLDEQLEGSVRYAVGPLFEEGGTGAQVLSRLAGSSQRYIASQGRDTIQARSFGDPVTVGYARVPQPGCCSFCGMLASRGATYRSEAAARRVVGRGVNPILTNGQRGGQGRGVRARGNQKLGEKYHDFCRCVAAPVFLGGDNSAVLASTAEYLGMYAGALRTDLSAYSKQDSSNAQFESVSTKATLAAWRAANGTK
jgi:hypothetical protein